MSISIRIKILNTLKALTLPLLLAVFPALFLYGNNVTKLMLPSLGRTLLLYSVLAILIFSIFCVIFKGQAVKTANAAFVFLIFFNLYGIVYSFLIEKDLFRVVHFTLLPFSLLFAVYASWFATKVNPTSFWKGAVFVMSVLVVFNLVKIVPGEVKKSRMANEKKTSVSVIESSTANKAYPDIYFIIFDEFAGFDSMRSYWHFEGVDDFVNYVKSKGFFVAENSTSSSLATFHQLAERLNYIAYPIVGKDDVNVYFNDIYNNQVMRYLKSQGYITVSFEETSHFFGGFTLINADYSFDYDSNKMANLGILFDDFGILVADNSMLRAFSNYYKIMDPTLEQHRTWINFIADNVGKLNEIPSPKFVYVHLILPHVPFMFAENGDPINPAFYYNWDYYLGNYKYAIQIAERMINNILSNTDPNLPPVIIIQSDHGARNILNAVSGSKTLENFPEEYKYHIMNIMYLPGFDTSQLPQDIKPINTFPIIFNHLFNANIPLQ